MTGVVSENMLKAQEEQEQEEAKATLNEKKRHCHRLERVFLIKSSPNNTGSGRLPTIQGPHDSSRRQLPHTITHDTRQLNNNLCNYVPCSFFADRAALRVGARKATRSSKHL